MPQVLILVGLSVWALIQNVVYWSYLPAQVAIHFNAKGVADNWLDRDRATALMLAIQIGLPWGLVFVAKAVRYMPASMVNIPHREYWLQPERREATLATVFGSISWIAVIESVFFSVVNHLTFMANRTGQPLNMPPFIAAVAGFVIVVVLLILKMSRRFALPAGSQLER